MLSDRDREILTAYVDGELSSRQRRYVVRLLHRSGEARLLLEKLKEDSGQLRRLEAPPLETDLAFPVLRTIAERHLTIQRPSGGRSSGIYPLWFGAAVAAAALFLIAAGSYFFFAGVLDREDAARLAQTRKVPPTPGPQPADESPRIVEKPKEEPARESMPEPQESPAQPPTQVVQRPVEKPVRPEPPATKEEPVLTAPSMEMFKLETANVALPVTVKLRELNQDANRQKLLKEWRQDTAFRLELPCKDGTRAFERFQKVWKEKGNSLLIDQVAQGRLKQPRFKTNYVVVAEDLKPEELLQLLHQLAAEDKKGEAKRPPDVQFDALVSTRMTKRDHKELSELLGVDLVAGGAGQGGANRPEAGKVAAKPTEHHALALAYNPVRPRPGSAEVKRFLESRKPARPGTVQVLLVLRGPSS